MEEKERFQKVSEPKRNVKPKLWAWLEGAKTTVGGARLSWSGTGTEGGAGPRV